MKAFKSFLQKSWAIVSAIKPEESMVSQRRPYSKSPTTSSELIGVRESIEKAFKKRMQSLRCENNSGQSIFSFTDAELANAAESVLSKIDLQNNRLTVGDFHQEVAKEMVREKLNLSHPLAVALNKYIKSGGRE